MTDEADLVVQRWIIAFCEMPSLVDVELMKALLAEHDQEMAAKPD